MFNLIQLLEIDTNHKMAGGIAIAILGSAVLFCVIALIFKKILLKRRYRADDEFVKQYKENLKKQEQIQEQKDVKPESIQEDF